MIRHTLLALLAAGTLARVLAGAAQAQSVPVIGQSGEDASGKPVTTRADVAAAIASRLDASRLGQPGGVAPLDANGLVPAANMAQVMTDTQGLGNRFSMGSMATCNSTEQLPVQSAVCIRLQAPAGVTFSVNLGLTSSDGVGEKVALYTGAHALSGSSLMWARNALLRLEPGSRGGQVDELDLNNSACDPGNAENPVATCQIAAIGTLITGLAYPYPGQSAIEITSGLGQLWHQGVTFAGDSVRFANIWENTSAPYVMRMRGTHNFGMDFTGATFGGAAVSLNTAGSGQSIVWVQGAATTGQFGIFGSPDGSSLNLFSPGGMVKVLSNGFLQAPQLVSLNNVVSGPGQGFITTLPNGTVQGAYLKTNSAGDVLLGSLVPAGGAKLDAGVLAITTTGPITTTSSVTAAYVGATGELVVPVFSPASSNVACAPGQMVVDDSHISWCGRSARWVQVAGAAFAGAAP